MEEKVAQKTIAKYEELASWGFDDVANCALIEETKKATGNGGTGKAVDEMITAFCPIFKTRCDYWWGNSLQRHRKEDNTIAAKGVHLIGWYSGGEKGKAWACHHAWSGGRSLWIGKAISWIGSCQNHEGQPCCAHFNRRVRALCENDPQWHWYAEMQLISRGLRYFEACTGRYKPDEIAAIFQNGTRKKQFLPIGKFQAGYWAQR